MAFDVDAAVSHVLLKGLNKNALAAALGKLNAVFQAPSVELLVCAGSEPVEVVAVGVLKSHVFEMRCGVIPLTPSIYTPGIPPVNHQQLTRRSQCRQWVLGDAVECLDTAASQL